MGTTVSQGTQVQSCEATYVWRQRSCYNPSGDPSQAAQWGAYNYTGEASPVHACVGDM